jgi:ElaB/YqjD/DUF883 family membrane-anchored ribosome-binding protein
MIQPVKNRISGAFAELPEAPMQAVQDAIERTQEAIEEHPAVAVMTAFAIGIGVGVGLAALLNCATSSTTSSYKVWSPF